MNTRKGTAGECFVTLLKDKRASSRKDDLWGIRNDEDAMTRHLRRGGDKEGGRKKDEISDCQLACNLLLSGFAWLFRVVLKHREKEKGSGKGNTSEKFLYRPNIQRFPRIIVFKKGGRRRRDEK